MSWSQFGAGGKIEMGKKFAGSGGKYGHLLWFVAGASVALFVLQPVVNPGTKTRLDFGLTAELLLVFVLAVEGLIAIRELSETRRQLRFDAVLRIYDFSRELHSLAFLRPQLWRPMSLESSDTWNEERELMTRYAQLFFNLILLQWEAAKHGYIEGDQWEEDAKAAMGRLGMREFWSAHDKFYPKDFRAWVDGILQDSTAKAVGHH